MPMTKTPIAAAIMRWRVREAAGLAAAEGV
jgi:hypothetical protein